MDNHEFERGFLRAVEGARRNTESWLRSADSWRAELELKTQLTREFDQFSRRLARTEVVVESVELAEIPEGRRTHNAGLSSGAAMGRSGNRS